MLWVLPHLGSPQTRWRETASVQGWRSVAAVSRQSPGHCCSHLEPSLAPGLRPLPLSAAGVAEPPHTSALRVLLLPAAGPTALHCRALRPLLHSTAPYKHWATGLLCPVSHMEGEGTWWDHTWPHDPAHFIYCLGDRKEDI